MSQERTDKTSVPQNSPQSYKGMGFLDDIRYRIRNLTVLVPIMAVLSAGSVSCNDDNISGNTPDAAYVSGDAGADSGPDPDTLPGRKDLGIADEGIAGDSAPPDSGDTDPSHQDQSAPDSQPPDSEPADTAIPDAMPPDTMPPDTLAPDQSSDGTATCETPPNVLDFSLNTVPTGGKVLNGGVNYNLTLAIANIDSSGNCKIWAESSNNNDPGLLNGTSGPVNVSPAKVTQICAAVYTTPKSDFGHTVTFYTEITHNGCVVLKQSVPYLIEKP